MQPIAAEIVPSMVAQLENALSQKENTWQHLKSLPRTRRKTVQPGGKAGGGREETWL